MSGTRTHRQSLQGHILESDENARNITEFGFGVNEYVNLKEYQARKKRLGTIYMAIGDGIYHGQSVA